MSFVVVIPARYASTRLPGKPLVDIAGKPMIQHVFERARMSQADQVVIATDDERIYDASKHFDAWAIMTSESHPSGTDRLEEVAREMDLTDDDVIVNVQGDEPLIPPSLIDQVASNLLAHPEAGIATLCERIYDAESVFNPNVVKVVFNHQGYANYFSRAPIPWSRDTFSIDQDHLPQASEYYRHIGIYAYRVGFLKSYVAWPPSMTEQIENLEQLRALSNGVKIHVELATEVPQSGVDTPEDLERVRALIGSQNG